MNNHRWRVVHSSPQVFTWQLRWLNPPNSPNEEKDHAYCEVKYVWPMDNLRSARLSIYPSISSQTMYFSALSQVCSLTSTTCLLRGRSPPGAERPETVGDSYLSNVDLIWKFNNRVLLEKIDLSMVDSP